MSPQGKEKSFVPLVCSSSLLPLYSAPKGTMAVQPQVLDGHFPALARMREHFGIGKQDGVGCGLGLVIS